MNERVPDVLTIGQLADYLQISKSTIYKLVQGGRLPGQKAGRQWRFHRLAIDGWLAGRSALASSLRGGFPKGRLSGGRHRA